jgi:DNA-binding NarL/FixJ family response regulator
MTAQRRSRISEKASAAGMAASDLLTPRQLEVLLYIAEGVNTKQIAHLMSVSVKTAETHRALLMQRLGIFNVAGLTRYAIRQGLIEP